MLSFVIIDFFILIILLSPLVLEDLCLNSIYCSFFGFNLFILLISISDLFLIEKFPLILFKKIIIKIY